MVADKTLTRVHATHLASKCDVAGYEIHIGRTDGPDRTRPMLEIDGRAEGAASPDGRIMGSYVHGIFGCDEFRTRFLRRLGADAANSRYDAGIDTVLDKLAKHLETHVNIDDLLCLDHKQASSGTS